MMPNTVAALLRKEKAEALEEGHSRSVEIDGTVIARIRLSWARDRDMEALMHCTIEGALTQVAFVHLTLAGESMVRFPWNVT